MRISHIAWLHFNYKCLSEGSAKFQAANNKLQIPQPKADQPPAENHKLVSRPDLMLSLILVKTPSASAPIKGEYRISNTELRMSKLPRLGFFYFDI